MHFAKACNALKRAGVDSSPHLYGLKIMTSTAGLEFLHMGEGALERRIAVRRERGREPSVVWLGGFKSDMKGTKAAALAEWARSKGRSFVRFDYSGHGESDGAFEDGTIGRWADEAEAVVASAGPKPILVGSSMGGWISLLVARRMKVPPTAMVLIAPAPDFTEALMWANFSDDVKRQIETEGSWIRPSAYDSGGYPITRGLIEDGRRHLVMNAPVETGCPVHVLQGMQDEDVPWTHALALVERIASDDVVFTLIRDGDHRLSRDRDIAQLIWIVEAAAG
jgi:pimeloyl-ACP methyl ester carboxylesterase